MADRPIIFTAPMVAALLAGRKTQTRRVLKLADDLVGMKPTGKLVNYYGDSRLGMSFEGTTRVQPLRYAIGDLLWVRETWSDENQSEGECIYRATVYADTGWYPEEIAEVRWRPSTQMPRWASRITLTVTDVRVQRVQDTSEADAIAEGLLPFDGGWAADGEGRCWHPTATGCFANLWDMIHGDDAWDRNDWVEASTFTMERRNIDDDGAVIGGAA